jgi:hypothetical protein
MIPRQHKPSPEEALNQADDEQKSTEERWADTAKSEDETDEEREERYLKGPTAFSA